MRTPNRVCDGCGKPFYKRPLAVLKDKTHCCSYECQNKLRVERMTGTGNHQFGLKGSLNSSFKSDWKLSPYGYILVRCVTHPLSMYDGYVFAHRLILEEYLKENDPGSENLILLDDRLVLSPDVVVHHKDGNKTNNSIGNLEVMVLGDHVSLHNQDLHIERNPDGSFRSVGFKKSGGGKLLRKHIVDAGQDIYSSEDRMIYPSNCEKVRTSLRVEIPIGYVGLVWSRSGLSVLHNIEVGAGCIDSGYVGEVCVVLYNHGVEPYKVKSGDAIAQLLTVPISLRDYRGGEINEETDRGDGGFGHTGV